MGEKDYQQLYLVRNYIHKKYTTRVYPCRTVRNSRGVALSSRNSLLKKNSLKTSALITNKLLKLKHSLLKKNGYESVAPKKLKELIQKVKKQLINKYNIKIEYLECRNSITMSTNLDNKPFKLFVAYYLDNVRLIDNF